MTINEPPFQYYMQIISHFDVLLFHHHYFYEIYVIFHAILYLLVISLIYDITSVL